VSYHHGGDQYYYDRFCEIFDDRYEALTDNSLDRRIDSGNAEYVIRRIRELHITGSSCTLVLCGSQTPTRRYVDWEIDASLRQQMAVVGIGLPTIVWQGNGTIKPARLQDNIDSGYAGWVLWENIVNNPGLLLATIEASNLKSGVLIDNQRVRKQYNG